MAYILHTSESNVKIRLFRLRGKLYKQMNGTKNDE